MLSLDRLFHRRRPSFHARMANVSSGQAHSFVAAGHAFMPCTPMFHPGRLFHRRRPSFHARMANVSSGQAHSFVAAGHAFMPCTPMFHPGRSLFHRRRPSFHARLADVSSGQLSYSLRRAMLSCPAPQCFIQAGHCFIAAGQAFIPGWPMFHPVRSCCLQWALSYGPLRKPAPPIQPAPQP